MRLRRRKPDYKHIDQLEAELNVGHATESWLQTTSQTLERSKPRLKNPEWTPGKGIELAAGTHPLRAISQPEGLVLAPGVKWEVPDHDRIRYLTLTATCSSAVSGPRLYVAHS